MEKIKESVLIHNDYCISKITFSNCDNYNIDVPVRINVWTRSECQKKQFDVIKEAKPSILLLVSDGGRNETEWDLIFNNRKIITDNINWNCVVYTLYFNKNYGMYGRMDIMNRFIWSVVDRCIMLEDDIIPSISFFSYCAELLEKYKDDYRIEKICGMNHLGVSQNVCADYFFSSEGSIWGYATWRRVGLENRLFSYYSDQYIMNLLKKYTKREKDKQFYKKIVGYGNDKYYDNHIAGPEFWYRFDFFAQGRLQIIPKYNMISNIGYGIDSTNSIDLDCMPAQIKKLYLLKTYELKFPLNHPLFVINDFIYAKKVHQILCLNNPFRSFKRKCEMLFRSVFKGKIFMRIELKKKRGGIKK